MVGPLLFCVFVLLLWGVCPTPRSCSCSTCDGDTVAVPLLCSCSVLVFCCRAVLLCVFLVCLALLDFLLPEVVDA